MHTEKVYTVPAQQQQQLLLFKYGLKLKLMHLTLK